MAWCSLDTETMTLLCKSLPPSVTRLNIAGCRKTMTDDSKCNIIFKKKIIMLINIIFMSYFRC